MAYGPFDKDSMLAWIRCRGSVATCQRTLRSRNSTIALPNGARSRGCTTGKSDFRPLRPVRLPRCRRHFRVILDAERAGNAFVFENLRGDGNPAPVTDEGHEFALFEELPREREHLWSAATCPA